MWEAVNQSAHEPVVRLLPYLRLKHRQAELALTLITLIKHEKAGSGRPLTDEQEQARRLLFEEAQLLNEFAPPPNVSVALPHLRKLCDAPSCEGWKRCLSVGPDGQKHRIVGVLRVSTF